MEEILQKLKTQEKKIDQIAKTVGKIKLYFIIILVLSVVTFVLPLIGLVFVIPWFLETVGEI